MNKDQISAEMYQKFHDTNKSSPRCLIYSEKMGLKSVIATGTLSENHISVPENASSVINQLIGRWTDFNYFTEFNDSSYRECPQFDRNSNFLKTFYDSKNKSSFLDTFEEDTRKLAESCDWVNDFNIATDGIGSIGACTLHALEYLNDEFTKNNKLVVSFEERFNVSGSNCIEWENLEVQDGSSVGAAMKLALLQTSIFDQKVTWIPLASFSKTDISLSPLNFTLKNPQQSTRFFSGVFYDLFSQQAVPGRGSLAALKVLSPDSSWDLTTGIKNDPIPLSKWRNVPFLTDMASYEFSNFKMTSFVDFNSKHFSDLAQIGIQAISQPRSVTHELFACGISDELANTDFHPELLEKLHQVKDSNGLDEDV